MVMRPAHKEENSLAPTKSIEVVLHHGGTEGACSFYVFTIGKELSISLISKCSSKEVLGIFLDMHARDMGSILYCLSHQGCLNLQVS